MIRTLCYLLAGIATLAITASAHAVPSGDVPAGVKVQVFPEQVSLKTARDFQSLVVQAVYPDGITREITADAKFSLDKEIARLEGAVLKPVADGEGKVTVEALGQKLTVPVKVADAKTDRPISFRLDVMPVFSKSGCNSGSCHGAARGKDGFNLSLFGYDPKGDYYKITRQIPGRRINLASPADSLLLAKAVGKVQHTGGELFTEDSDLYATILRWLEAGAPDDPKDVASVTGLDIMPKQMVLDGKGAKQQMVVTATYSDGTTRDVTKLSTFITSNDTSAGVDPNGVVTGAQRGEAFIMARFDAYTVGSQAIVLPKGLKYEAPPYPANNYIDEFVAAKHKKLRIIPSELCSDEVFLRRATIDITGKLPTTEEYAQFMADTSPDKREKLVDRLLERKEFVETWVMKFAELLQIRSGVNGQGLSYKATLLYYNWLSEQFQNNVPMNEIAQKLLSASGSTFANPATNFYEVERNDLKLAENVAQVFLGMRLQCAQCHNHPFDRWTQNEYYNWVAFFKQIGRKKSSDPRDTIIFNSNRGEAKHPLDGRVMPPKFLGGEYPDVKGKDRRKILADWLASPDNPYFARNLSNIVWAHFFGRGIVDPVDDVRVSNPPSNPELLDALAKKFTEYNFDFKKLVRDICTSRTYQLSTQTNESNRLDTTNFSRSYIRRVRAEVLFDMIAQATATADNNKFKGLPRGARAVQIADGRTSTYFLKTFGRASRETVCSCEVKMEPNLSQALHLLNGNAVHNNVRAGGLIKQWLQEKKSPEQITEALYIRCFARKPTDQELSRVLDIVNKTEDKQQAFEDLFWAMLNTKEFLFNH